MQSSYDLVVAYRIYPKVSKIPAFYPNDKFKLALICFKSFVKSIELLNVKFYIILDGCPPEYDLIFLSNYDPQKIELIHVDGIGNAATFNMQLDILSNQNDSEFVYFAEDDYFLIPDRFKEILSLMKNNAFIDFSTIYNHPDYYNLQFQKIRNKKYKSPVVEGWEHRISTTGSFMSRKSTLIKTKNILREFNFLSDIGMWLILTKVKLFDFRYWALLIFNKKERYLLVWYIKIWFKFYKLIFTTCRFNLYSPNQSIGTHIEKDFLAPKIDWEMEFRQALKHEN
jgi:hypothetical protein